jgi:hypothetical protein
MLSAKIQDKVKDFYFYPLDSVFASEVRNAISTTLSVANPWKWVDPHDTDTYSVEDAMSPTTFSHKRQTYAEYERSLFAKNIAALEASVAALKAEVKAGNDDAADKRNLALAAVSFVFAVIAIIIGSIAMCRGHRSTFIPPAMRVNTYNP